MEADRMSLNSEKILVKINCLWKKIIHGSNFIIIANVFSTIFFTNVVYFCRNLFYKRLFMNTR